MGTVSDRETIIVDKKNSKIYTADFHVKSLYLPGSFEIKDNCIIFKAEKEFYMISIDGKKVKARIECNTNGTVLIISIDEETMEKIYDAIEVNNEYYIPFYIDNRILSFKIKSYSNILEFEFMCNTLSE